MGRTHRVRLDVAQNAARQRMLAGQVSGWHRTRHGNCVYARALTRVHGDGPLQFGCDVSSRGRFRRLHRTCERRGHERRRHAQRCTKRYGLRVALYKSPDPGRPR